MGAICWFSGGPLPQLSQFKSPTPSPRPSAGTRSIFSLQFPVQATPALEVPSKSEPVFLDLAPEKDGSVMSATDIASFPSSAASSSSLSFSQETSTHEASSVAANEFHGRDAGAATDLPWGTAGKAKGGLDGESLPAERDTSLQEHEKKAFAAIADVLVLTDFPDEGPREINVPPEEGPILINIEGGRWRNTQEINSQEMSQKEARGFHWNYSGPASVLFNESQGKMTSPLSAEAPKNTTGDMRALSLRLSEGNTPEAAAAGENSGVLPPRPGSASGRRRKVQTSLSFNGVPPLPQSDDASPYCLLAYAASTPRRTSTRSNALTPIEPLDLDPLAEALETGSEEGILDAVVQVRASLRGSLENKDKLVESGMIRTLLLLLGLENDDIVDNVMASIFNVCQIETAKPHVREGNGVDLIVGVLQKGRMSARESAAATLFCLSDSIEVMDKMIALNAIPLLMDLLKNASIRGQKDACLALFAVSRGHGRKVVNEGAVKSLLGLLEKAREYNDLGLEEKAVAVLASLAKVAEGRDALKEEGGIEVLADVMDGGSQRAREDALGAMLLLVKHDKGNLTALLRAGVYPALRRVMQKGSSRAAAKAKVMMDMLETSKHVG